MLKFLQERVNKATKAFDEQPKEAKHTAAGGQKADQIAGKQSRVQQLMRKLAVKLNKENHAEEER